VAFKAKGIIVSEFEMLSYKMANNGIIVQYL